MAEQILKTEYSEIMQKSYIDYSMSVITARALPDIRDGLKPVQRRVLYAMDQLGLNADKPHRKSARIVGDAMGKYHPHGDSSIYETLVVMSQDFKKGMALVDGHGNFGSIEGDGAAAMRYTEAKLKKFTQEVFLADLDKDIVDFIPNFDGSEREPEVLPVRVPNLLINGADGIAVGMVTNIPTHNLGEVADACIYYLKKAVIDSENVSLEELMDICPGPDFPTGGIVINRSELPDIYRKGAGKIKIRGKITFEEGKGRGEKDRLVITEIPYTMIGNNIAKFMQDIISLIENRQLTDIADISNESSKDGIRIVLELKKGADTDYIKNTLYKKTKLEDTFGVNMLAIVNGKPETLGLLDIIRNFTDFQLELNTRKYTTLLKGEELNKEIKEGLIRAVDLIDLIIEILRGSKDLATAKECLINGRTEGIRFKGPGSEELAKELHFTERQADAILGMRLYRLIGLELDELKKEYDKCLKNIKKYTKLLKSRSVMTEVIIEDLEKIKANYKVSRKTVLEDGQEAVIPEKPLVVQNLVLLMDRFGYVKTIDRAIYDKNKETADSENKRIMPVLSIDTLCIFTDKGNMHRINVASIPQTKLKDKGVPIDNLGNYKTSSEEIVYMCLSKEIEEAAAFASDTLVFVTGKAMMKRVDASEFIASKRTIAATKLGDNDKVIKILDLYKYQTPFRTVPDGQGQMSMDIAGIDIKNKIVSLISKKGYKLKFSLEEIPSKKKSAIGVRGMKLDDSDELSLVEIIDPDPRMKIGHRDSKGKK
ncbi:MAG: DNA gyrase subunit A [Clostridiales bacterium]|nr:DNA gyrase subunit A [Clostridiales bacterium]MDU1042510.1 DNA gyrase subunit A [Clostridiales bacterium]